MTYFHNIDLLKVEFDYRTEQLRGGIRGRRGRRTTNLERTRSRSRRR